MSHFQSVVLGASLVVFSIGTFAQDASTPRVDARQVKQEKRIENGVQSGQLTGREAVRLEKQQGHVAAVEARPGGRYRHHGRASTPRPGAEPQQRSIHHQKHDAQTAASAPVKR